MKLETSKRVNEQSDSNIGGWRCGTMVNGRLVKLKLANCG